MTFTKRVVGRGVALGLAIAGFGLAGGSPAQAQQVCSPVVANKIACADIGAFWRGVVVADTDSGVGTGVAVACGSESGVVVLYVVQGKTYSTTPTVKTGAEGFVCP
jgi:hypothetical protein